MVNALLYGENRGRHGYVDGLRRILVGVVLAALVAASCVGWSFVRHAMAQARLQDQQRLGPAAPAAPTGATPSAASPGSGR